MNFVIIALCILLLALVLARKGLRYTLCLIPGMFLFIAVEAYVSTMLMPAGDFGDFLDMFFSSVTVPMYFFLVLVAVGLVLLLNKLVLRFAYSEQQSVGPFLKSPSRLVAVVLLMLAGISLITLDLSLPHLMRDEKRLRKEEAIERASNVLSEYFKEQANKETVLQAVEDLPSKISCAQLLTPGVEKILRQGNTTKAAALIRSLEQSCMDSPTLDDLVRKKQ